MNFSWILYHQLTNQKLHVHPTPLRTNGYPAKKLYNWKRKKPYFKASIFNDQPLDFQQRNWDVYKEDVFFSGPERAPAKIFPSSYHPRKKTMSTPGFQGGATMVAAGQPWSRLNLLPSEALRRATHVRRLQFRSGEPPLGWEQDGCRNTGDGVV